MKRIPLIILLILALLCLPACATAGAKGAESSISGMNDITRLKVIADRTDIRSGCSTGTPVIQTAAKDTKFDVVAKVADWYAVMLANNNIGFVPQGQATPVIPEQIKPGTAANYTPAAPETAPGTAPGGKVKTPDTTKTNYGALTAQEQEMLKLINQARAQASVPALQADMELTKVARIKSQDMIDNNYFSHNSPKYGSPFDMMKSFGIKFVRAGENIAGNQSVQAAHTSLMNSPGHRKNILSTDYTHIGVGIQRGGQYGGLMFTQEFISKPT